MRLRMLLLLAGSLLVASACQPQPGAPAASLGAPTPAGPVLRGIKFPVRGPARFIDDWGDCRGANCSRHHEGVDLLGTKLTPLVAAASGKVTYLRLEGAGKAGNSLAITDAEGWTYWYLHINNDSPGTDDGKAPKEWVVAPGITKGAPVTAGQVIAYLGDSGNAEATTPHLHFEIDMPGGRNVNPYPSLQASAPTTAVAAPTAAGLTATPNRALRKGMSGVDVLAWQNSLVAVGAAFVPNGHFGPATDAHTRAFQRSAGLKPDGIVGPATRAAMAARQTA